MDGTTENAGGGTIPPDCRVDPQHCDTLRKVAQSCAGTRAFLEALARCGLPVDDRAARNEAQYERARALQRELFPEEP